MLTPLTKTSIQRTPSIATSSVRFSLLNAAWTIFLIFDLQGLACTAHRFKLSPGRQKTHLARCPNPRSIEHSSLHTIFF